jgi:outer membrane PBP1 activator LpoA protein
MKPLHLVALSILLLLGAVPSGGHDWDPAQVSATTRQLESALDALLEDPKLDARQATAVQQREHEAAIATARQIRDLLPSYRKRIDEGYSLEDSRPFWDQIDELRGDIQAYARHSWLPPETDRKADRVSSLFDQLAHYYKRPA